MKQLLLGFLFISQGLYAGEEDMQEVSNCSDATPHFADIVQEALGASGKGYGDPNKAANGVYGGGLNAGSLDVFSLDKAKDGQLTLAFSSGFVCNGPGYDFNVFENGFRQLVSNALFFEPVVVSVSFDGIDFVEFPHTYLGGSSLLDIVNENNWQGFAGMSPVFYHEVKNNFIEHGIDPLDPLQAGGDAFDLDNLPDSEPARTIKTNGFRFIRLTGASRLGFPSSPNSFGGLADIDGVYAKRFITIHD